MEYSYKVIIFQASCRKVKWFPTKIVVNLIENVFKVKILGCEHLSGESKANLIMDTLTKSELNIEHLRG